MKTPPRCAMCGGNHTAYVCPRRSREDQWRRINAMAGFDENGCLLPPAGVAGIDRTSVSWWKTRRVTRQILSRSEGSELDDN